MNTFFPTVAVTAVLDYFATESENAPVAVAESLPGLLEVLGDQAPNTAGDLLDLVHGLLADPRVRLVVDDYTIVFSFDGR
jgi:hypothetical protein